VVRASDDVHELGACARIGAEVAEQLARDHRDALLADAPRRHALVDAFDDDADALRLQHVLNAMRDLRRHRLLDLKPAGEGFDDAGELADADDLSVRKIADVHLAGDRRHVMLAVRLEADVAQHDHLVVAVDLVERAAQELDRVVFVAAEPVLVGADDARRRAPQSFAARVVADPAQKRPDRLFGFLSGGLAQDFFLGSVKGRAACRGGDGTLDRRREARKRGLLCCRPNMSVRRIIEAFEAWRRREESLVLATVYDTLGSTYTKA